MTLALIASVVLFVCAPAHAETVSPKPGATVVTLYQSYQGFPDIGLIRETRTLDLPAGDSVVRFDGVASTLIPQTARLEGLPGQVTEQNFDYDLYSPANLLKKSVGTRVELIQTPLKAPEMRRRGTLMSEQGMIRFDDGSVEALGCGGPPARLSFETPAKLRSTPSLSAHVHVTMAGRYPVTLSYLAGSLQWAANYVFRASPDLKTLRLEGRVVITNTTDTAFAGVPTRFIAGKLSRLQETQPPVPPLETVRRTCWALTQTSTPQHDNTLDYDASVASKLQPRVVVTGMRMAAPIPAPPPPPPPVQENLGDVKLYRLERPIDIGAHQQKLFALIAPAKIKAKPVLVATIEAFGTLRDRPARLVWRIENRKRLGLGLPLPHGEATLYGAGSFAADTIQNDVPEGQSFELHGPNSAAATYSDRISGVTAHINGLRRPVQRTHTVTIRNATGKPEVVEARAPQLYGLRIVSSAHPYKVRDGAFVWALKLAPHAETVLTFVSETTY